METKVISLEERAKDEAKSYLEELLSEGARKLLQRAIENEVAEYLAIHQERRTDAGQRAIVRNGHHPERELVTGIGPIKVRHALIPALYLKGISTGDFTEALSAILGERASGLSATNVVRLKAGWEEEYKAWCRRDLSAKAYVYWWADGIYFNVRLDEERSCVLVLMGALEDGTKELLAVVDGYRESTQSWRELLQQLKRHGLTVAPKLAVGDVSLGFCLSLPAQYCPLPHQRFCLLTTPKLL